MRRIGPVFNEDHRHDLRFRPKCYKKIVFWQKKHGFLYQKTPDQPPMVATSKEQGFVGGSGATYTSVTLTRFFTPKNQEKMFKKNIFYNTLAKNGGHDDDSH